MDDNKNIRQIEKQLKEIKESIWKIEKSFELPTDEFYVFKLVKDLETRISELTERLKVLEMMLKVGDYQNE